MRLLTFGILQLFGSKYAWLVGIVAVVISQILVILFWKDAKFGTLPNILILFISIASYGHYHFQKLVQQETKQLLSQNKMVEDKIISENDIEHLPEPVKNWIRNSGVIGSGTFNFNTNGEVTRFYALRYKGNEATAQRYDWIIDITDYKTFEGIKVPTKMTSTWKLAEGDWNWLKLEVTEVKYNKNASLSNRDIFK